MGTTTGYEEELRRLGGFEKVVLKWYKETQKHAKLDHDVNYHKKELKKAKKLAKLNDERLLALAKKEREDCIRYHKNELFEYGAKAYMMKDALNKINLGLKYAKNPNLRESLEYQKKFYEGRLNEITSKDTEYQAEKLTEERRKTDFDLLSKKRMDINWHIKYHTEEIFNVQIGLKKYQNQTNDLQRVYNRLKNYKPAKNDLEHIL